MENVVEVIMGKEVALAIEKAASAVLPLEAAVAEEPLQREGKTKPQ